MQNGPSTFSQRFEFHAYVSVAMMIGVLDGTFKTKLPGWKAKLTEMIPSYGRSIAEDAALCAGVRAETAATSVPTPMIYPDQGCAIAGPSLFLSFGVQPDCSEKYLLEGRFIDVVAFI